MKTSRVLVLLLALSFTAGLAQAQEARRRFETMRRIRLDKFQLVLPQAIVTARGRR